MARLDGISLPRIRFGGLADGRVLVVWSGIAVAALLAAISATLKPGTTITAFLVLAVVSITLVRVDIAILLLVATGPLEAAFQTGPGGVSVTKLTGALCFASFALYALRSSRPLLFERNQAFVLGILAIAMVSTLRAFDTSAAITTTTRYASFAALYIVLTQLAHDPKVVRRIVWVLSLSAGAAAALALSNYLAQTTEVATLKYGDANDLAFLLATTLPLTFLLLASKPILRPVVVALIGLFCAAIMLSLSRGALVGIGVGIAFLLVIDRRHVRLILVAGLIGLATALFVIHSNPAQFQESILLKQHVAQQNVSTRLDAWSVAAQLAADRPFTGVGPGNFPHYYLSLTDHPPGTFGLAVAHDAYLDIAAELGIVAMLLFVLYLGVTYVRLHHLMRGEPEDAMTAEALLVSLVIAMVCAVFLSEQYFLPFWLIGGLATATWGRTRRAATVSLGTGQLRAAPAAR
jgi:O-antigen ligase